MEEPPLRCSITGNPIWNTGEGIYDDGEWVSWAYINQQIEKSEIEIEIDEDFEPAPSPQGLELNGMIAQAARLQKGSPQAAALWGRIGELYVAELYGVALNRTHAQGHDGRLSNDLVEVKTLTPQKNNLIVRVKQAGNFSLLAVVRVNEELDFDVRLVRRANLPKVAEGKFWFLSWKTICQLAEAKVS